MSDLGPADVPAVLQVGEEVLPRDEAGLYRQMFPNGMLAALQGVGRSSMAGLDSLSGNYLRDYDDVLTGRERGWRALATLGTPMVGAGVNNAGQFINRGGEALLDYLAESRLVAAMPGRMQIPTARVMAAGRDAALGAAEVGEGALNGAEAYTWGQRAAPMRYDDRSGAVVDQQGRSWYHDGGTVLEPGGALRPVDYVPDFEEESLYWHHRGELAGGGVQQPGGERSTLYQAALPGPGGRSYNVPTVWDGQIVTTDEARDRAAGQGWRFPSYATPDAADLAYEARVHPRAAADTARYEELHEPFPTAAERRGRELMAPGRDAIGSLLPAADPNLSAPYDRSRSFRENALDPERINNAMGIALGFAGGTTGGAPRNAMLGRIEQLTGESLGERLGDRVPGYPRRSFSEIQRTDKGELEQLEPRSLYDRLPDPIRVYHGSTADFTTPDFSKIGTGEGNTTFSHGLYWGGARGTGEAYQRAGAERQADLVYDRVDQLITPIRDASHTPQPTSVDQVKAMLSRDPHLAELAKDQRAVQSISHLLSEKRLPGRSETAASVKAWRDLDSSIKAVHSQPGHLYEADLYVEPDKMLDWDAKLDAQSDPVKRGLAKAAEGVPDWGRNAVTGEPTHTVRGLVEGDKFMTGAGAYRALERRAFDENIMAGPGNEPHLSPEARASSQLREAGIQGVRYLDQLSRNVQLMAPNETTSGEWIVKQIPNGHVHYRGANEAEARAAYDGLSRNYVTYSDKPIDVVSRDGEPIIPRGYNFRLTPVDHEPEF